MQALRIARQPWGYIVLVAALLTLCPASARAAPFTPRLERAYAVAERYWGGGPANCLTLDRQVVPDYSLPEEAEGWATIATEPTDCVLYVERHLARPNWFIRACGVLVHELGRLRGLQHSDDPASVMYAFAGRPPPICWRAGLAELNRRH